MSINGNDTLLTDGKILASEVVAKLLEKEQGFIVTYNKDTEFAVSYDACLFVL